MAKDLSEYISSEAKNMKILITGAAGFIGFHLTKALAMQQGISVVGVDNINDYYDTSLKWGRLEEVGIHQANVAYNQPVTSTSLPSYKFRLLDIVDKENLTQLFEEEQIDIVCNLAAQAGVRYSLENPDVYIQSNIVGFLNILEACRSYEINRLVYASSSSVYGLNEEVPFATHHQVDHPISLYAASKKSNELMAHAYSHLYNIPTIGLRFFTVYGPWGRPDMAYFLFTDKILHNKPIDVYNHGEMSRDFTYIDDIIEGLVKTIQQPIKMEIGKAPYKVYNIGNNKPVNLLHFIECIEEKLGIKATKKFLPLQPGDVTTTWADVNDFIEDFDYAPNTPIEVGVANFVNWYQTFYQIKAPQ